MQLIAIKCIFHSTDAQNIVRIYHYLTYHLKPLNKLNLHFKKVNSFEDTALLKSAEAVCHRWNLN